LEETTVDEFEERLRKIQSGQHAGEQWVQELERREAESRTCGCIVAALIAAAVIAFLVYRFFFQ